MNDNIINLATSPLAETFKTTECAANIASTTGGLARALETIYNDVQPQQHGLDVLNNSFDSISEVNSLPCYKVTCNLHSVNSVKPL